MSEQQPTAPGANETGNSETGNSEAGNTETPGAISDEQLPPDLQPNEDNPLARHPGETGNPDDQIGAGIEGGDAANPSASMGYRTDGSDRDTTGDTNGDTKP